MELLLSKQSRKPTLVLSLTKKVLRSLINLRQKCEFRLLIFHRRYRDFEHFLVIIFFGFILFLDIPSFEFQMNGFEPMQTIEVAFLVQDFQNKRNSESEPVILLLKLRKNTYQTPFYPIIYSSRASYFPRNSAKAQGRR